MANSFPEEVLEHVFSFIQSDSDRNSISMVCKSWYEIERWCRRRIFIGNCYAVSPRMMIRRFPDIRSIELKGKPHFADFNLVPEGWGGYVHPWIAAMADAYPWLEEIKLKRMVVTDETLELIAKSFKNFKLLVLSSCEGFSTDGLAAIAANCRFLSLFLCICFALCLFWFGCDMGASALLVLFYSSSQFWVRFICLFCFGTLWGFFLVARKK